MKTYEPNIPSYCFPSNYIPKESLLFKPWISNDCSSSTYPSPRINPSPRFAQQNAIGTKGDNPIFQAIGGGFQLETMDPATLARLKGCHTSGGSSSKNLTGKKHRFQRLTSKLVLKPCEQNHPKLLHNSWTDVGTCWKMLKP
jgi:hypothetical protein